MKFFWSLFATAFLLMALMQSAEAAPQIDSDSFTHHTFIAAVPAKSALLASQTDAATGPWTQTSTSSLIKDLLNGLFSGSLFAFLFANGAFDGIQWIDILWLVLTGLVLLKLFRRQPAHPPGADQHHGTFLSSVADTIGSQHHPRQDLSVIMNQTINNEPPINLPQDFDRTAFVQRALDHYRLVQQAWNDGDMRTLREYVVAELYTLLARQRATMAAAPPQTEVLDLAADIVLARQVGSVRKISLLFRGHSRDHGDHSEDRIRDTWHLERDMSIDDAPWLITGIEASE
ncbi:TIM44-like domain-containing protein [Oceanobacter sp. 5_MG-2023]|uniref:Tim44 domain-containing protein n=1 Tax=Oceanobacter sp. 5_MG-2023 TaxID=3062645 RepID=UPI0026E215D4|nr:TIM44-like domain-containing protein [Oceanobacter sp. 5_MG-2023]MDO6682318.1 TIM44-like domain-containing protein [Oceanobacter sp. 5_MG-2023]